ncbi:unnamed protein product, partial [Hymenolepis diminuta]
DTDSSALLLTSPVCTVPSFSYNRPDQLKHAYDYILMCVLTRSVGYNQPSLRHTHTKGPQLIQRIFHSSILLLQFSIFP